MATLALQRRKSLRTLATDAASCVGIGLALGVLGPFGSYLNDGLLVRVAYWTGVFALTGVALCALMRLVASRARAHGVRLRVWLPILVLAANLPASALSRFAAVAAWPRIEQDVSLLEWFGQSLLITTLACSAFVYYRLRSPAPRPATPASQTHPMFFSRLPARLGRDIVCLQMEDHYVRVHTCEGSILVLMPLKQAMAELAEVDGMQVHRSWWVVRRAVVGMIVDGRSLRLTLANGLEAPVARSKVAQLRASSWIG